MCAHISSINKHTLSSGSGDGLGSSLSDGLSSGSSGLGGLGLLNGLLLLHLGLLLLSLLLLAEQGAEDAGALAGLGARLGGLLLLLLGGGLLSLLGSSGLLLLLLLGLLGGDSGNGNGLGQLLQLGLVALAGGDGLLLSLGLGGLGLDGDNPAVALSSAGGLEGVLVASNLELELAGALLGDIRDIGLKRTVLAYMCALV